MVNDVPGNSSPFPPKFFSILGLCLSTSLESPISRWRMVWVLLSIKTAVLLFAEKPKLKQIYTKFSNLIYFSCYPEVTTSFLFKVYTPNICNGNQFNMLIILIIIDKAYVTDTWTIISHINCYTKGYSSERLSGFINVTQKITLDGSLN